MNKFILLLFSTFIFAQTQPSLLSVNGKYLIDDCGQNIILKGVNHGNTWTTNWGIDELPQIAQTNSNTVRLCFETIYYNWNTNQYVPTTTAEIEPVLIACLAQKMIPIIELHDWTSDTQHTAAQTLSLATNFWTQPSIVALIKKYQNYIILNIANEVEHWDMTENNYYLANKTAIQSLRNTGIECPIMIDGMHWGQDYVFFINKGTQLLADDPLHKLLFSVHTYWENMPDSQITSQIQAMANSNLPFVIGEMSKSVASVTQTINYNLIMQLCTQYDIGFLVWWWGFYNASSNNELSMTPTGTYNGLTGFGLDIAVTNTNSIQNKSIKSYKWVNGNCILNSTSYHQNNITIYPIPTTNTLNIDTDTEILDYKIYDINNKIINCNLINSKTIDTTMLAKGFYILKITLSNGIVYKKFVK